MKPSHLICLAFLISSLELLGAAKPNILFISIDDLRPQLGAYGESHMLTPNLDQLASEGRVFNRHYVQVPTCGPSRACLLTGKNLTSTADISHRHLAQQLAEKPEPQSPETFLHHFKRNGYQTIGMGKISHNGEGRFGGKDKAKSKANELPHSWSEFIRDPENSKRGQSDPLHCYAVGNRFQDDKLPFEMLDLPDEAYPDGRLANLASAKLKKLAQSEKPFFMTVGFYKPHLPFTAPKKYWDLYERSEIPLAPSPALPKDLSDVFTHPSSEFYQQYRGNREKAEAGKQLSPEYSREILHANFAATSYVDAQVGKVLDQLKSTGLSKNTIVIVWSDHGWCLGDHTIWGKHTVLERALRSVLMVKLPTTPLPGKATSQLVATIDLYPTLCELAGLPTPADLAGKSFVPLIKDPEAKTRDEVLSYWRDTLSLRTDRYHFALYDNGKQKELMLFDHQNDPNETTNIAATQPQIVAQLMPKLRALNKGYLPMLTLEPKSNDE